MARRVVAVLLVGLVVGGCVAAAMLSRRSGGEVDPSALWLAGMLVEAAAGLLIVWIRPRNAIGWLLIAAPLFNAVSLTGVAYGEVGYATTDGWPAAFFFGWVGAWTWIPSLLLPIAVLPAIYPSGKPASPAWRALAWVGVAAIVALSLRAAVGPLSADDLPPGGQLPFTTPTWLAVSLLAIGGPLAIVAVIGGLVATVVRTFRASSPERDQLVWLLLAIVPILLAFFAPLPEAGQAVSFFLPPIAVAVGVLRHQLLGIRVVLNRTLFYAPLTAVVALAVAGVSTVIARIAPDGPIPLLAAAAVVAVLVGPISGWLRRGVDRITYGRRGDPLDAVDLVGARGANAESDPLDSVLHALCETIGAQHVAVVGSAGYVVAEVGSPGEPAVRLPLRLGGDRLGELVITPLRGVDAGRIVGALLPHIATVVHARALTHELEIERERVTTSRNLERERIRADLHDGLGPCLSGISLGLQAADLQLSRDPAATRATLRRIREEADVAVGEVRRVIDGLRPGALVLGPLAHAVRSAASGLGFDRDGAPELVLRADVPRILPAIVEEAAFRIAQEALHNVVRHAGATRCEVRLAQTNGTLAIRVNDNGLGIDGDALPGVGIESMHRRARELGGTLTVLRRTVGQGTCVEAILPLATS